MSERLVIDYDGSLWYLRRGSLDAPPLAIAETIGEIVAIVSQAEQIVKAEQPSAAVPLSAGRIYYHAPGCGCPDARDARRPCAANSPPPGSAAATSDWDQAPRIAFEDLSAKATKTADGFPLPDVVVRLLDTLTEALGVVVRDHVPKFRALSPELGKVPFTQELGVAIVDEFLRRMALVMPETAAKMREGRDEALAMVLQIARSIGWLQTPGPTKALS